jgi:hypothetical protein
VACMKDKDSVHLPADRTLSSRRFSFFSVCTYRSELAVAPLVRDGKTELKTIVL